MRTLIAAALALAAGTAMSAPVAHSGGDWVSLSDAPCPAEIAARVPPEVLDSLHAAATWIANKPFAACWAYRPELGAVILFYSDGDQGLLSANSFHEESEI